VTWTVATNTDALAVLVARGGRLPAGADEAVAEAGGAALVVGSGAREAAEALVAAERSWWAETGPGLRAGELSARLGAVLRPVRVLMLPASPDGRDLAPRLAAVLDRPLLASAVRVEPGPPVTAALSRVDGRLLATVRCAGPAVATLLPGARSVVPVADPAKPVALDLPSAGDRLDVEVVEVLEPDPSTMDLSEARRVFAGGAGLVARDASDASARGMFELLARVARALDASAGATRVATDAGWIGYERQIGTTGVAIDPELYVAFGISGASQHVGGLGAPRHVVSVNTDQSSPMTAMADLGLVTDAGALLRELAVRLGVEIPSEVADE
jgi:electron transfer flavoprotein alpha subunit